MLTKINLSKPKINAISTIFLSIFAILAGLTPSVIRACIMAELSIMSGMLYRKNNILNNLALSFLITGICNPYSLTSTSVMLSYGGVLRLNMFFKEHKTITR